MAPGESLFADCARLSGRSLRRGQDDQPPQVVGDGFQGEFELVFDQSQVTHDAVALASFPVAEDALNVAPPSVLAPVAGPVGGGDADVVRHPFS